MEALPEIRRENDCRSVRNLFKYIGINTPLSRLLLPVKPIITSTNHIDFLVRRVEIARSEQGSSSENEGAIELISKQNIRLHSVSANHGHLPMSDCRMWFFPPQKLGLEILLLLPHKNNGNLGKSNIETMRATKMRGLSLLRSVLECGKQNRLDRINSQQPSLEANTSIAKYSSHRKNEDDSHTLQGHIDEGCNMDRGENIYLGAD